MIAMYGTTENGEGYVMRLGNYETLDDVIIHVGMFAPDTELTFIEVDDDVLRAAKERNSNAVGKSDNGEK